MDEYKAADKLKLAEIHINAMRAKISLFSFWELVRYLC